MQYIREIFFLMDNDRRKLPGLVLLFIFASMLDIAGLALIGPYVNAVIDPENFSNSNIANKLVHIGFNTGIENILLFFPSYLKHKVAMNNSDKDRRSLAFNIVPVGFYGDADSAYDTDWIPR